ncbi:MAG: SDR family oxidoreductase [Candidatus Moraniibacteriota bacterium]
MDKYIPKVTGHALVLGAGGIGTEIIRALVANGASAVSFTYHSGKEKAEALKSELEAEGVKAHIFQLSEVKDETEAAFAQSLQTAVDVIGEEISVAVDTIGVSPNVDFLKQNINSVERDKEGWRRVFEVNVFSSALAARVILERMHDNGVKGSYVVISSTNGINSYDEMSWPYDESKASLVLRPRILSKRYAKYGIRVNGVAPGWIDTPMNKTLPADYREQEMSLIGVGRFAEPAEVASVVAFLSGSGASYIHGQTIIVDGYYPMN